METWVSKESWISKLTIQGFFHPIIHKFVNHILNLQELLQLNNKVYDCFFHKLFPWMYQNSNATFRFKDTFMIVPYFREKTKKQQKAQNNTFMHVKSISLAETPGERETKLEIKSSHSDKVQFSDFPAALILSCFTANISANPLILNYHIF